MPFAIDACAAMHIGDRSEQQDRVAIIPHPNRKDCLLAVLADGMGGHSGGAGRHLPVAGSAPPWHRSPPILPGLPSEYSQ